MKDTTFEYTSLQLNMQSLPDQFDALKLLIMNGMRTVLISTLLCFAKHFLEMTLRIILKSLVIDLFTKTGKCIQDGLTIYVNKKGTLINVMTTP